ncbi:MAG TPA: hypothetical protein VGM05_18890 [Planctomycetaceae bacterium]|jgi:hypothetical protein
MPQQPAEEPIKFDRATLSQPPKKSTSPVTKILLALAGCVLLMLVSCAGWFGYIVYQGVQEGMQQARQGQADRATDPGRIESGESGFKAANAQITVKTGSVARGNSEAAINLAAEYSKNIHALREAFFTKRKKKPLFSLSDGEFLTYCRLDEEACVFLVHVPDLRKFSKEAKSDLAELAWATGQQIAHSNLENPPPRLAVGVRGVMLYDNAMVGKLGAGDEVAGEGIESRQSGSGSERLLFSFFNSDVVPQGSATENTPVSEGASEEDTATNEADDTEGRGEK